MSFELAFPRSILRRGMVFAGLAWEINIWGRIEMYLNIEYRDGKKEQKSVDDCAVKDGCLVYYIRFGVGAGHHYIPLDTIKEFQKEN